MTKEQLDEIQRLTGYSLADILKMTDKQFWYKITKLLSSGKISPNQHNWLDKQRTGKGLDNLTIDLLDNLGGKVIK